MQHFMRDGVVCTNVELKPDAIDKALRKSGRKLMPGQIVVLAEDDISELHRHTPAGVPGCPVQIYVDESHYKLNARDWNLQSRDLTNFFTVCRHEHNDLIFLTQHADNIDKQIRRLVQFYILTKDLSTLPGFKWCPVILSWVKAEDRRTVLKFKPRFERPGIYKLYNSYQRIIELERKLVGTVQFDNRVSKKKGGVVMRLALFMLVVGVSFIVWAKFFRKDRGRLLVTWRW